MKTIELSIPIKINLYLHTFRKMENFYLPIVPVEEPVENVKVQFLNNYNQPILTHDAAFFQQRTLLKAGGWHVRLM